LNSNKEFPIDPHFPYIFRLGVWRALDLSCGSRKKAIERDRLIIGNQEILETWKEINAACDHREKVRNLLARM